MRKILPLILFAFAFQMNAQITDCSDLFISEYIEGPANNNAIEIYNPTNSVIDLSDYTVNRYSNGATSNPEVFPLSGTINPGSTISLGNGQLDSIWVSTYWSLPVDPLFYSLLDLSCSGDYDVNSTFYFNGDDAMTLEKSGTPIDIFGKVGQDPGSAWTDDASAGFTDANGGTWWSKRQTLVRKASVKRGVNTNPLVFNPTLEYDSLPDATYSNLGSHTCDCIVSSTMDLTNKASYVMYPNPVNKGGVVMINSKIEIKNIEIYDVLGRKVLEGRLNKIQTSKLLEGKYVVRIELSNDQEIENKLIIN